MSHEPQTQAGGPALTDRDEFKWPLLLRETHFSGNNSESAVPHDPRKETSKMLVKSRTIFEAAFQAGLALYLGYVVSELLLKSLNPDSWATPGILLTAVPFFFLLRWLRSNPAAEPRPKREYIPFTRFASLPKSQLIGKSVYRLTSSTARLCRTSQDRAPAPAPSCPKPGHCYGKQTLQPGA